MTKDHTQLAIENGAKGLNRGIVYFEEIAEFNATIEAAIKQAFDGVGYDALKKDAERYVVKRQFLNMVGYAYAHHHGWGAKCQAVKLDTKREAEALIACMALANDASVTVEAIDTAIGEKK